MPQTNRNQTWDSQGNLIADNTVEITDEEVEAIQASAQLRTVITILRNWKDDSLTASDLSALSAAQRIQRQAVIETRVAALSRICLHLIRVING